MQLVPRARSLVAGFAATTLVALSASAQYTAGGALGPYLIPSSGNGGATAPNWTVPTVPTGVDIIQVPLSGGGVPAGALNVTSVTIYNLSHTWLGDLTVLLESPSGVKYTLIARPGYVGAGYGSSFDVANADITIVDPSTAGALDVPTGANRLTGTYKQFFNSTWSSPSQVAAIANTNMSSIPIAPGVWTLSVYDWATSDSGTFDRWEMSGDGTGGPVVYCTAGTSSGGCVPSISATNNPSVTFANSCVIAVNNLEPQKSGIVFYGINNPPGYTPGPWASGSNSFLCVKAPTQRMGVLNSGGTLGSCNGTLTRDFNAYLMSHPTSLGQPFMVGHDVFVQGWYRDPPAQKTTNLSNALKMTFQ